MKDKITIHRRYNMNELSFLDSIFNNSMADSIMPNFYYHTNASTPKVDLKENSDNYTLEMELPGRTEKDINIELEHNNLTISSKTQDENKEEHKEKNETKWILKERYSRRFSIPSDVDSESIAASFKNGILTVVMHKKAIASPKKIAIEAC